MSVAGWARRRGYYVLPTYDYSGKGDDKAPKLAAPPGTESLVLPDLQCFRPQGPGWLEVKTKTRADDYRKGGYRVTGISLRLYRHYREVERVTKSEVTVLFLHERENEVRGDTLSRLRADNFSHEYDGGKMGRGGMVFFRYDGIRCWGPLSMFAQPSEPQAQRFVTTSTRGDRR